MDNDNRLWLMQDSARLFPIEDVVSVLTGALLNSNERDAANRILSHVSGQPVDGANESEAIGHLREQLPTGLAEIRIFELARIVLNVKSRSGANFTRELVIRELRDQFGAKIPICSRRQFEHDSNGLKTLIEIMHECFQSSTSTSPCVGSPTDHHTVTHEIAKDVE